jgi:tetratricopeptide (TPR) repeat protein
MRSGLRWLGWSDADGLDGAPAVPQVHQAVAARLLISLAFLEAEQGRTGYGLRLLDLAEEIAAAQDRGVVLAQRGLLFIRTWRSDDALKMLDEAVPLLDGKAATAGDLARALLNRGFLHLNAGRVRRARADFTWCQAVATAAGLPLPAAKAMHNLGLCELLTGDIPAALQLFNAALPHYPERLPGLLPGLAMDKARALLAVGLAADAASELDSAITAFRRQRLDYDLAEAELARAQAAVLAGEPATALRWAAAAHRRFRRRGNEACAALAELTLLRARPAVPGPRRGPITAETLRLADRLVSLGLHADADVARLLAARALLATGHPGEAAAQMSAVRRRGSSTTLEVSLLRRLARAELAQAESARSGAARRARRGGGALAELRAGLALVDARRGRLGSLDLQTGAAALGVELAVAGLGLALERGSAPLVFAWLERSRAQAFRVRPVRPPADPGVAALLAELRQLGYLIRTAELAGQRDPAALARRAELQREVREHAWRTSGPGDLAAQASLAQVAAALSQAGQGQAGLSQAGLSQAGQGQAGQGQAGQSLVSILPWDGRMLAVVLREGAVHLVGLGDFEVAREATRRLAADLDTLAGRRLPARMKAVISESIRHQVGVLTAGITAPLRGWTGDAGVILAPAGALASIPWGLLPDLRGRPVTVCPSASAWLAAWRRGQESSPPARPPLLVAGPDLEHAATEVSEIARSYPGCRPLLGAAATVSGTLRALDGAPLAHLAAHGHHDRENVLFSRLDLADGPLMAYDLQQLAAAPRQVILSACDVGRVVVRPGEEFLGFSAALLYIGAQTVISSVTRVRDEDAVGVMTGYHRALAAGAAPAQALATASAAYPLSPFVCFGSG